MLYSFPFQYGDASRPFVPTSLRPHPDHDERTCQRDNQDHDKEEIPIGSLAEVKWGSASRRHIYFQL